MSLYVDNVLADAFFIFAGGRTATQAIGSKQKGNHLSIILSV